MTRDFTERFEPTAAQVRRCAQVDTGTLRITNDHWEPPHYRPHACGYAYQLEDDTNDHLEWSAIQQIFQMRVIIAGSFRLEVSSPSAPGGRSIHEVGPGDCVALPLPVRDARLFAGRVPIEYLWAQFSGGPANTLARHVVDAYGLLQHLGPRSKTLAALRQLVRRVQADPVGDVFQWSEWTHTLLLRWWNEAAVAFERWRAAAGAVDGSEQRTPLPLTPRASEQPVAVPGGSKVLDTPPRTVQELADRLGYSRSHVADVMRRTWQESPGSVLRRDRLQRAAELLRQGHSVNAAAAAAGYATHQSFARAYRRHFGHPPSQDRAADRRKK